MRAVRTLHPVPVTANAAEDRDPYLEVLGEVVAELAERVELLETRERLSRFALSPTQSRHRRSP